MQKIILIFIGPPGSGKGTQAEMLAQKTGWRKLSTGTLFRQEIKSKSSLGKSAEKYIKIGKLVGDDLTKKVVEKNLDRAKSARGIILDGYPRNQRQLADLLAILKKLFKTGRQVYALEINISDEEAKRRLTSRRSCYCGAVYNLRSNPPRKSGVCDICGKRLFIRNDDKSAVVSARLKLYRREIKPIISYWQKSGQFIKIKGGQKIAQIHQDILRQLKEKENIDL